jgi:hypothetical protein
MLDCHSSALCDPVLQNGTKFGGLSCSNRVIADCCWRNCGH